MSNSEYTLRNIHRQLSVKNNVCKGTYLTHTIIIDRNNYVF